MALNCFSRRPLPKICRWTSHSSEVGDAGSDSTYWVAPSKEAKEKTPKRLANRILTILNWFKKSPPARPSTVTSMGPPVLQTKWDNPPVSGTEIPGLSKEELLQSSRRHHVILSNRLLFLSHEGPLLEEIIRQEKTALVPATICNYRIIQVRTCSSVKFKRVSWRM